MEMLMWINKVWNFENQTGIWRNRCIELNFGAEEYYEDNMPKYIEDIYENKEAIPDGVVIAVDVSDPEKEMPDATILFDSDNVWIFYPCNTNVTIDKLETNNDDKYFLKAVKEFLKETKNDFEDKLNKISNEIEEIDNILNKEA